MFLQLQWDLLPVETAVLAALYAPGALRLAGDHPQPEHRSAPWRRSWRLRRLLTRLPVLGEQES